MRRLVIAALFMAACALASDVPGISIRGKLTRSPDKQPALDTGNHKLIYLKGDHDTMDVLNDERLAGADLEALHRLSAAAHFTIGPIPTQPISLHKTATLLLRP